MRYVLGVVLLLGSCGPLLEEAVRPEQQEDSDVLVDQLGVRADLFSGIEED